MRIRFWARDRIAVAGAVLTAVALLTMACSSTSASAVSRPSTPHASAAAMPDAAVTGCDVLLTAPAGHHCLLPWPNDAFTVAANTTRPVAGSTSRRRSTRRTRRACTSTPTAQNKGDGFSPGSVDHDVRPRPEHREVEDRDLDQHRPVARRRTRPIVILDTVDARTRAVLRRARRADARTASEQLLLIHPAVALTEGHRYAVVLRNLVERQRRQDRAARRRRRPRSPAR